MRKGDYDMGKITEGVDLEKECSKANLDEYEKGRMDAIKWFIENGKNYDFDGIAWLVSTGKVTLEEQIEFFINKMDSI